MNDILCKQCKKVIIPDGNTISWRTREQNEFGWVNVCTNYDKVNTIYHKPMDNLDYIEHLAKERNLV